MIGALADLAVLRVALAVIALLLGSTVVMAGQLLPAPMPGRKRGPDR